MLQLSSRKGSVTGYCGNQSENGADLEMGGNRLYLAAAATALRVPLLSHRPMHADEAILADKFGAFCWELIVRSSRISRAGARLPDVDFRAPGGQTSYAALTEPTLRITPAVAGVLVALSPLVLAPAIGGTAASRPRPCWRSHR